ncbi:MAG: hypothetical protein GEU93_17245 [Propionibacteriales bacterium]|nr:hypothetical protein [Propionibacteriales bacterium]
MGSVETRLDGHVATLSFANPAQRGALKPEMLRDLRTGLARLEGQYPDVRVVVLRGSDGVFSSGYAINRIPEPDALPVKDEIEELCEVIEASPLVLIAMLEGTAVGASLDIACACDIRFATSSCRMGITPAKLGIVYTVAGAARLHRHVGAAWTRALFFTGDLVSGEEAARIGLVSAAFGDASDLERHTYDLAERIASRAPFSVASSKRIIHELEHAAPVKTGVALDLHELRRVALRSADAQEARAAFKEKRPPRFTGKESS